MGEFFSLGLFGGISGDAPDTGETFTLQVSIENHSLANSVPEPSSLVLLSTGLIGFVGYGCRRRKRRQTPTIAA